MGVLEGTIPLGRTKHRWKNNTKMNLTIIMCKDMDWVHLAQDRDQRRAL
jgi:hypothetical protein